MAIQYTIVVPAVMKWLLTWAGAGGMLDPLLTGDIVGGSENRGEAVVMVTTPPELIEGVAADEAGDDALMGGVNGGAPGCTRAPGEASAAETCICA